LRREVVKFHVLCVGDGVKDAKTALEALEAMEAQEAKEAREAKEAQEKVMTDKESGEWNCEVEVLGAGELAAKTEGMWVGCAWGEDSDSVFSGCPCYRCRCGSSGFL